MSKINEVLLRELRGFAYEFSRADQWTTAFHSSVIDDALLARIRPCINIRWSWIQPGIKNREFWFIVMPEHRTTSGVSLLSMCCSHDIMACCYDSELSPEVNQLRLESCVIFCQIAKRLRVALDADFVCGIDLNGHAIYQDIDAFSEDKAVFENSHIVFRNRGWNKYVKYLEEGRLIDLDNNLERDAARFVYRNIDTGEAFESDEMCPEKVLEKQAL